MFKRLLALLVCFAMVFSMLPVSAFAEETSDESIVAEGEQVTAPEKEETVTETTVPEESIPEADEPEMTVISGTVPMQVNPLYAGLVSVENIPAAEPIAPLSDPVYGTTAEAVSVIREAMKARVNQFDVYIQTVSQDFSALHRELFLSAMEHTGASTEGDYLLFQYGSYDGDIYGSYDAQGNYYMTFTYSLTYLDTADQQDAVDAAVASLLSQLNLYGKSDYEKICGIYDWMCANITYDHANLENEDYTLMYTAYAALINRTAVCQGYANLFYRLALELGVDSRIISGISNGGNHAWNIIKLGSKYYDCDATWDAEYKHAGYDYEYFLKNEADFAAEHVRKAEYSTAAFHAAYPMAAADYVYFGQEEFDNAVVEKNGRLTEDIIITGDVVFNGASPMIYADESRYITIADGGSLTIAGGSFLTFNENISVIVENGGKLVAEPGSLLIKIGNGSITIKKGGTLTTTGAGDFFVSDLSSFTVESGANLNIDAVRINLGATVSGVDNEQIRMSNIAVSSTADLQAALATYSDYAGMDIYTAGSFELTENLVIPAGIFLSIEPQTTVTVARGVTLVNEGEIWIYSEGTLVNNGTFENTGKLELPGGTFIDNSTEELPYFGQEEFDAILVEQDGFYYMAQDVIITGDVTFSSGNLMLLAHNGPQARHIVIAEGGSLTLSGESFVAVQNGGSITVENGGELTMDTDTYLRIMNNCSLTVKAGGVLNACDAIVYVTAAGNMAVESGATLNMDQVMTNPGSNITGIALSEIRMADIMVSNVAELNAAIAEYADYAGLDVYSMGFTFDQDTTIPANVVFGVAMNTTATVNAGVTLTNNGTILLTGTLVNNGTFENTGKLELQGGTFIDNSIPSFVSVATEQELLDQLAEGAKYITIATDMEINADVQLFGTTVQVDNGVTLTVNSGMYIDPDSVLTVDGKLVINGDMNVEGLLITSGEVENNGTLWINNGGNVNVQNSANLVNNRNLHIGFGDEEKTYTSMLQVYGTLTNYGYLNVVSKGKVNAMGTVQNVMDGEKVGFMEIHGAMTVSGMLINESYPGISLDGTLRSTGTYNGWGVIAVNAGNPDVILHGFKENANVEYHYGVGSMRDLKDAITEAQNRGYLFIDVYGSFDIDLNIALPDNVRVGIAGSADAPVTVKVLPGVTLTNAHGSLSIEENATLLIEDGATFYNNGDTAVRGGMLNVAGNYTTDYEDMMISVDLHRGGEVFGAASCFIVDVENFEQLRSALEAAAEVEEAVQIKLRSTMFLNEDLVIPANVRMAVISNPGNDVLMIVPYGVTLTNHGILNFSCSQLTVQSGGAMENYGQMQFNAAPLGTGGGFFAGEFINQGAVWFNTGAFLNVSGTVTNDGMFHVGFGEGQVSEVTITGSFHNCGYLNLNDYAIISVSGQLYNNSKPETWAQIDLRGQMEVPGCLYNYSDITVWGQLIVSGEMINHNWITVDGGQLEAMNCSGYGQITVVVNAEGTSVNIPEDIYFINAVYRVDSVESLREALALSEQYNWLNVEVLAPITLDGDLLIPHNVGVNLCYVEENPVTLTVPAGMTLTNQGDMSIQYNSKLDIQPDAVLSNWSSINVYAGTLNVDGSYEAEYGVIYVNLFDGGTVNNAPYCYRVMVHDLQMLEDAMAAAMQLEHKVIIEANNVMTLEQNLVIPAHVTLMIAGGPGMTVTVNSGVTLTNNGEIEIAGEAALINDGTLVNNGSMLVRENCKFQNNGSFSGNQPVIYLEGGRVAASTEADLIAALEKDEIWAVNINTTIELTEELSVYSGKYIYIVEGGALIVPAGITLNLDGSIGVENGELIVEEGAQLINNGCVELIIGTLFVAEESYQGNGQIFCLIGNNSMTVPEYANINYNAVAWTLEELENILSSVSGMEWVNVNLEGGFDIDRDITIPNNVGISLNGYNDETRTYTLTNATLTNNGHINVSWNAVLNIAEDATLQNDSGVYVNGVLNVNGQYASQYGNIVDLNLLCGEVNGTAFRYSSGTEEFEMLQQLLQMAAQTDLDVHISIFNQWRITEDITIPENVTLFCNGGDTLITVAEDVTLTNHGRIFVCDGAAFVNVGIIDNQGALEINPDSFLINDGVIEGNPPVFLTEGGSLVAETEEELITALNREDVWEVWVTAPIMLTQELTVWSGKGVRIAEGGALNVPEGITLNVEGGYVGIDGGELTVDAGALLINYGCVELITGTLTVAENAYEGYGDIIRLIGDNTMDVPEHANIRYTAVAWTVEELQNLLTAVSDYNWVEMHFPGNFEIAEDITIPSNVSLNLHSADGQFAVYTISNATLTVNGHLYVDSSAELTIAEDADVKNNGDLYIAGTLNVYGQYSSDDGRMVGAELESGKVNGAPFHYNCGTEEFQRLQMLLEKAAETDIRVHIGIYSSFVITEDITIAENVELEISNCSMITVAENTTVTNFGRIFVFNWSTLINNGAIDNQGALEVVADSVLENYGTITGNDPVFRTDNGEVMVQTEEELLAALYDENVSNVVVVESFALTESLSIPEFNSLVIANGAVLTVPENVTLTVEYYSSISIQEGSSLIVEEGGMLYNDDGIMVNGGSMIVKGEYHGEGVLLVELQYESSYVEGVDDNWITYAFTVGDMEGLQAAITAAKQRENTSIIQMFNPFDITQSIEIPKNVMLDVCLYDAQNNSVAIAEGVTVTNYGSIRMLGATSMDVLSGAKLINYGRFYYHAEEGGQVTVHSGASLVNKTDAGIKIVYGMMTLEEGTFAPEVGSFVELNLSNGAVAGIDNSWIHAYGEITSAMALHVVAGAGYRTLNVVLNCEATLECDMTFREKDVIELYEGAKLIVPAGRTLTIEGELRIYENACVIVEEGGNLINNGTITAESGVLDVVGHYSGDGEVHLYCEYGQINVSGVPGRSILANFAYVTDAQTLVNAMTSGFKEAHVQITGNIVLTDSLIIPAGCSLHIADYRTDAAAYVRSVAARSTCASLTVPEGKTLTVEGTLANDGNVIVAPEAVLVNKEDAVIENTGSLIVEEAASVVNEGELVNGGSVVVEEAATMVNEGALVNSGSVVVEANAALNNSGTIEVNDNGAVIVQSQGQINNNGDLVVNDGELSVEEGGVLEGNRPEGVYAAMVNGVDYETFAQALTAAGEGDTVQLLKDIAETEIKLGEGITLDLNGHVLQAEYVFAVNGSNIVDSSEDNTGLLKVNADSIVISSTNAQLPVRTGEGYIFIDLLNFQELHTSNALGQKQYIFSPTFESVAHQYLAQGKDSSGIRIAIRMTWQTGAGSASQTFVFLDETVKTIVDSFDGNRYSQAFYVTVSNAVNIDFDMQVLLISDAGMELACN